MDVERSPGCVDREFEHLSYDIESRDTSDGRPRFIEVKGRLSGMDITVTRNQILYSLDKPDDFSLAIVEWLPDDGHSVHYFRRPFQRESDFGSRGGRRVRLSGGSGASARVS